MVDTDVGGFDVEIPVKINVVVAKSLRYRFSEQRQEWKVSFFEQGYPIVPIDPFVRQYPFRNVEKPGCYSGILK